MEDKNETKKERSENLRGKSGNNILFLKTFFHFAFLIHHYVVSGFCVNIVFSITEEQLKIPKIQIAKTYGAALFTNWNFVSNFFTIKSLDKQTKTAKKYFDFHVPCS